MLYEPIRITEDIEDILKIPGIWKELQLDVYTGIWEGTDTMYYVTENARIISSSDGTVYDIDDFDKDEQTKWMLIYNLKNAKYRY